MRCRLLAPVAAAAALTFTALTGCTNQVESGDDFIEPDDLRDNVDLQGLADCTERSDTGYRSGSSFAIEVVTVDGRPVEVSTADAYIAMQSAAASAGVSLRIVSGFRTMAEQTYLYGCYVHGNCNNGNLAAKPGYSNHQSGHALDLNTSDSGVATWLSHHAASFGFARTVPSEAWHYEWWGSASDYPGPCGATPSTPPASCDALGGSGGVIDNGDGCFSPGGPSQYLRDVESEGNGGDLLWTGATSNASAVNFADWNINLAQAGSYTVEAYVDGDLATSQKAAYKITHNGTTDSVVVDQSTGGNRWVTLGAFDFASGGGQRVRVGDNTGEASSLGRKIVLDAIRVTPVADQSTPPPPPAVNDCPYVSVTAGTLNVRASPNTVQSPVGTLTSGLVVRVLSTVAGQSVGGDTDWHRIQTSSLTGYVSGAYTTCRASP
ncbi:MAG TPA: D-alanyl-D-alanine carboxypeptidase family protein [Myxococcota bacterium]|jgi:D-alanyl-D-alanine carboxypeptidase